MSVRPLVSCGTRLLALEAKAVYRPSDEIEMLSGSEVLRSIPCQPIFVASAPAQSVADTHSVAELSGEAVPVSVVVMLLGLSAQFPLDDAVTSTIIVQVVDAPMVRPLTAIWLLPLMADTVLGMPQVL